MQSHKQECAASTPLRQRECSIRAGTAQSPQDSSSSLPAKGRGGRRADASPLECAHLRQENSRLLAENRQLSEQ